MKVSELIEELSKYDGDMEACSPKDYPCDFKEIEYLMTEKVCNHSPYGYDYSEKDGKEILVLS